MKNCFSCINWFFFGSGTWFLKIGGNWSLTLKSQEAKKIRDTQETNRTVRYRFRFEFYCNLWWNYAEKCNKISSPTTILWIFLSFFLPSLHIHFNLPTITFSSGFLLQVARSKMFPLRVPKKGRAIFPVINFTRIIYLKCHLTSSNHWKITSFTAFTEKAKGNGASSIFKHVLFRFFHLEVPPQRRSIRDSFFSVLFETQRMDVK